MTLKELSNSYIDAALEAVHGRKAEAAKLLDVNRRTLYRREKRNHHAAGEAEDE